MSDDALVIETDMMLGNVLGLRVVRQDFDRITRNGFEYTASNGIQIKSSSYPSLYDDVLYVRGRNNHLDNEVCIARLPSAEEAETHRQRLIDAVAELNKKLARPAPMTGWF